MFPILAIKFVEWEGVKMIGYNLLKYFLMLFLCYFEPTNNIRLVYFRFVFIFTTKNAQYPSFSQITVLKENFWDLTVLNTCTSLTCWF